MTTVDELERRMRPAEAEIRSEKEMSHAVVHQAVRNGAALNVLRSDVDRLIADMAGAKSDMVSNGATLTMLRQDVAALRNDQTAIRREIEELRVHMDARFDAILEAIRVLGS